MYTLYHTVGNMLDRGIYHTRSNGELVRQLTKENADFVHVINRKTGKDSHYFFIFEYEKGDIIEIEGTDGKKWYTTLNGINSNDISSWHYYLNCICRRLVVQKKPLPANLDNLFKELLPSLITHMKYAQDYKNRRLYIDEYSWMVKFLGKKLADYVNEEDINSYLLVLVLGYDLKTFEDYMNSKEVKIRKDLMAKYENAKKNVAETIEIAKNLIEERKFKTVEFDEFAAFPDLTILAHDTPCGNAWIHISYSSWKGLSVKLTLEMEKLKFWPNTIDITEECKEFASLYI